MKLTTKIGQILLTHPKDQNYTTLYEEALTKSGRRIELYAAIEIEGVGAALARDRKKEYEKVAQNLVAGFKRAYISARQIDQDTFEKSLAAVNAALSKIASQEKAHWYGGLNVALAALYENTLSLSVAGNARVYLHRNGTISTLSEELVDADPKPTKIFSNFANGKIARGDRVIISTNQLFNYLSLERLQEFMEEDELRSVCKEIIDTLGDIKTIGFATFIFELGSSGAGQAAREAEEAVYSKGQIGTAGGKGMFWAILKSLGEIALAIFLFSWEVISRAAGSVFNFFKYRPKKYLVTALLILLAVFAATITAGLVKKSNQAEKTASEERLLALEDIIENAEAAVIIGDENQVVELIIRAKEELGAFSELDNDRLRQLRNRLAELEQKLSKEIVVENPTVLTELPNIPTDLIRSPNGFLAFNRNTGSLSFYDFRTGQTRELLASENTSSLITGTYVGDPHGYIFLKSDGAFVRLDIEAGTLQEFENSVPSINLDQAAVAAAKAFGRGLNARVYALDTAGGQIYRSQVQQNEISQASRWLSGSADFQNARDLSIDGGIYVLFPDKVQRFFAGQSQGFNLSATIPAMNSATKIFTSELHDFIYIADPDNERILIYDKDGNLQKQIKSPVFRDLSDLYADEANTVIQALAGSELLQIEVK